MGAVIEFDGADKGEIRGVAKQIVEMLGADLVEVLLPFAFADPGLRRQHIGHPHLGKDPGLVTHRQIQHPEEGSLGGTEQGLLHIIGQALLLSASAPEDRQHKQRQQQQSR